MKGETAVGGIRCSEVLAILSDVLAGEVDAPMGAKVHDHLAGCDNCTRFGGAFARAVHALRGLRAPSPTELS